jgi:hypothetical protein
MPLNGTGVEPRFSTGNHTIVLHFDRPMQTGTVTASPPANVDSATASGSDIIVQLSGVVDKTRVTLTGTNLTAADNSVLNSASLVVGFLQGDTNQDTRVNIQDTNQAKANSGSLTNNNNAAVDVNIDGRINVADVNFVKAHAANALPPQSQRAPQRNR